MRSTRRPAPAFGPAGLPPLAAPPLLARVPLLVSVIAASSWANALAAPLLPGVVRRVRKSISAHGEAPCREPVMRWSNVCEGRRQPGDGYCDAGAGAGTGTPS